MTFIKKAAADLKILLLSHISLYSIIECINHTTNFGAPNTVLFLKKA